MAASRGHRSPGDIDARSGASPVHRADVTHVAGADGAVFEVLNIIDDHSRLCVASRAFVHTRSSDVVRTLHRSAAKWGFPERFLSDNGGIFTATFTRATHSYSAWTKLANGMGVDAARADSCEGLADLLAQSFSRKGPFLIELLI